MTAKDVKQEPEVMVFEEAAAFLRTSPRKLWELVQAGEVPYFKVGSQYRFLRSALLDRMREQMEAQ